MPRTTPELVQAVLLTNYDAKRSPDLNVFIMLAGPLVDRVSSCAVRKGVSLTAPELRNMETMLAAHFYAHADPLYKSRTTADASGEFQTGTDGTDLGTTQYGVAAMNLDWSGCLKNLSKQQRPRGYHLGGRHRFHR
jgi:hypothetical protein